MTMRAVQMWAIGLAAAGLLVAGAGLGCTYVPNQFKEQGPSTTMDWNSPTATDICAHYQPAAQRHRDWPAQYVDPDSGEVSHLPLYFEDPFVDKGSGRTDETDPHNVYRGGWEDYVAMPYGLARFTGNWLLLPASMVVTPPWTILVSDGKLSKQLLGYDHDAEPTKHTIFELGPPPPVETSIQATTAASQPAPQE
jgi:hypothetical protein